MALNRVTEIKVADEVWLAAASLHRRHPPFDHAAAAAFAGIRRDRSIAPPDAIQLACASVAGVDMFITNDHRLSRQVVPGIHFIQSFANAAL